MACRLLLPELEKVADALAPRPKESKMYRK